MLDGRMISEMKIDEGIMYKLSKMPDYVKGWHLSLKASKKTAATRRTFVNGIYHFLSSINPIVSEVRHDDITEYKVNEFMLLIQTTNKSGRMEYTSDSYQGTMWSILNNFFRYMVQHGLMKQNYMELIERPANRDLDRINENRVLLTSEDFTKMLQNTTNPRDMAILAVFMSTGMRKSALISIMLDDVDLDNNTLKVIDKGNKRQVYHLSDNTCSIIKGWLDYRSVHYKTSDGHLFVSNRGKEMGERTVRDVVEKCSGKALGKSVSPHKLRSGYCSILYNKTGDIEFVRRAVGHSRVDTTQRYIVTNRTERAKAAELMDGIF